MLFKCHNCGVATTTANVIKKCSPTLYDQYVFHRYKNNASDTFSRKKAAIVAPVNTTLSKEVHLDSIKDLPDAHFAKQYVKNRLIPESQFDRIYYTDDWGTWCGKYVNDKYEDDAHDERVVLPFFDLNGNLVGAQGRGFEADKKKRYLTAKAPNINNITFGLEKWNKYERTYIVEGPFDSLFIPNSLAVATSDLFCITERVGSLDKNKTVFVFDNEPESKELGKLAGKVIRAGFGICIWPKKIREKDINDMVLSGLTPEEVISIIDKHTKSGLAAELDFSTWRKFI